MITYIKKGLLLFIALSAAEFSFSQSTSLPPEVVAFINKRIESGMNPSIVVGVIDKNGPQYYSFGKRKNGGKRANEHSIYEIGSISKVFTAILLADKVIQEEMETDDPIEAFLPATVEEPTYDGQHITLGHLSDHTSSLPREPDNFPMTNPENPFSDYSLDMMYDFISRHKLCRPIGSDYEYSNLGAGLLGNILANHAGKTYEELMLETIARPLQMNETKVTMSRKMKKNLAVGHHENIPVKNWDLPAFEGAGGIKSSTHDMLIFLAANLQLFEHPLRQAMLLTHMPRHNKGGEFSVGLGWHIYEGQQGDVIWHNGGTGGYSTFAGFVKETGKGVVVMTNSTEKVDDIGMLLLNPSHKLPSVVPHIAIKLREHIDKTGVKELVAKYDAFKKEYEDKYDFSESGINSLGYYYLRRKQFEEAKAIFLLNIKEYPASANVYDSYAEALMESGDKQQAILFYKKSLEINPGNLNAIEMLAKIGEQIQIVVPEVSEVVLESYVGTYQLVPGFQIVISRNGTQLEAQATNQQKFPIFPKSETEFYYKVVDAQIVFTKDKNGGVESLTLFQNGREIVGKKIK